MAIESTLNIERQNIRAGDLGGWLKTIIVSICIIPKWLDQILQPENMEYGYHT
jgi:hypothetical protein